MTYRDHSTFSQPYTQVTGYAEKLGNAGKRWRETLGNAGKRWRKRWTVRHLCRSEAIDRCGITRVCVRTPPLRGGTSTGNTRPHPLRWVVSPGTCRWGSKIKVVERMDG